MTGKHKISILLSLVLFPPIIILLGREFLPANYFFSSLYKIIFLSPLVFRLWLDKKTWKLAMVENFSWKNFKNNFWVILPIGLILAAIYLAGFLLAQSWLDLPGIAVKLSSLFSISVSNLIFIGLYVVLVNSLLEEFFWRGFLFAELNKLLRPGLATIITGIAFSFHHLVFYYNWFNLPFFLVVTVGLSLYAMIMNYLFARYRDLFSCWLVHALADAAQIIIAFKIFGLI